MHHAIRRGTLAVLALATLAACSDEPDGPAAGPAGENEVQLVKLEFEPAELTVAPGTEVTWTWTESLAHNVVAEDGSFESEVQPTGSFTHTFDDAGTYPYECTLHTGMVGEITVE